MSTIIVLATTNKNKILEFKNILEGTNVEIRSVDEFGPIPPAIEDGLTFDENAYKKAHHTAKILGLPAIADDSGLVVPALNGEPGVFSARYAGENANDAENTLKLLKKLKGKKTAVHISSAFFLLLCLPDLLLHTKDNVMEL